MGALTQQGLKTWIIAKKGQPLLACLLVIIDLLDWCGGGDLNPYALRR